MTAQDKLDIRLFVDAPYAEGEQVVLEDNQAHYIGNVMRCDVGDAISLFNGRDGQWRARVAVIGKRKVTLELIRQERPQQATPDIWLVFSPIKTRSDEVVEKAVELGASHIVTVVTRHAVVKSVNHDKLRAHAIEAAEQCGRMEVPELTHYSSLEQLLATWPTDRTLLHADESGAGEPLAKLASALPKGKYAVLVGPEGGFSAEEHHMLSIIPQVRKFGMGPRILRADTASVVAMACVQSWLGDWEKKPDFKAKD